ncbi:transient receptor potential cation channel subfamily A member 1-like isoform X2 [Orbicella faveolata]|uniref:transient receptor potential cation channel subfamily A member 1-like isoform X2 n=1 Tax=Orbicella faveolata TaxID=48498 RepID=UPI0009E63737|nr:transient receptor potential cation channel subfamily A member 1-like isoform X2 [Orbicella faveolata]
MKLAIYFVVAIPIDPNKSATMENKVLSPLHYACWFNAPEAVSTLLDNNANVESCAVFGQKPLHYAVTRASVELVKTLLTKGKANPNGQDNQKFSPLHLATQRGRLDIIKLLFAHGADLRAQNDEHETVLHVAAREGWDEVLRYLLQRASMTGISCKDLVNSENHESKSCLHLAVDGGHVEAAKICIEYGADVRPVTKRNIPLHVASSIGDLTMVKFLLSQSVIHVDEEDSEGMTPILRACLSGHVEIIEHLITKGAAICSLPGSSAPSPLMCAAKRGHNRAILFLLQRGSPIDLRDSHQRTCLHVAAHSADVETVDIILENGGRDLIDSLDKDNRTPIHYAASKGSYEIVQKLLDAGANINVKDAEENVPIHMATESGNLACVRALLRANPKSLHNVEYRLRTSLHFAAYEGHLHLVKFLLDNGANPDQRDENHLTPLLLAARLDRCQTITMLLDCGAKIGAVSKNKTSAIDIAAYFGNSSTVRLLLDRGADVKNKSVFGKGCLDSAIKGSREQTCMEIIKHKRWKESVEVKDDEGFCMMKQLIEKFPDVAKVVMDKCVETSDHLKTDADFSTSFNFVFLDPIPGEQINDEGIRYFGPKLMLKHGHRELILHPLTQELMRVKRSSLNLKYFYLAFFIYSLFTVNLTFLVLCLNSWSIDSQRNSTSEFTRDFCPAYGLHATRGTTAIISGISLLSHIYRIYCEKWSYWMDVSNLLELCALICAIITIVSREIYHNERFEFSFGIMAVLLAYLTLMSYLQSVFKAGIYVTMMFEVLRTLLVVFAVFSLLLFAFALVFHALLSRQANASRAGIKLEQDGEDPFGTLDLSILKVLDMMIGELEYSTFFVDKTLYLPDLTRFIFAVFCALIPIVFMNLLIGLAVGDIESIQKNAELKLLAIEIEDVYSFERRLPNCLLRRIHKSRVTKYPNRRGWRQKGVMNIRRLIAGMKDNLAFEQTDCESFEQAAASVCHRMDALEQK